MTLLKYFISQKSILILNVNLFTFEMYYLKKFMSYFQKHLFKHEHVCKI